MIKIIAVIGFIFAGIVIDTDGAPNNHYLGVHTWHNPGAFTNGFKGFVAIFINAAFAFAGTELVGLAAAETGNPRKEVPKASKQFFLESDYILRCQSIHCWSYCSLYRPSSDWWIIQLQFSSFSLRHCH